MIDGNDPGRLFGRGLSFPPRVGTDGRMVWSEGEDNIREAIRVILLTDQRSRIRLPQFGGSLEKFLFEPNTPATHKSIEERIRSVLTSWEPRIVVEAVTVKPDPEDQQAAVATIAYKLVATQARERVSLSVPLNG